MSPYPVQTDRETIIETARILIERDGVEHLSLGNVAAELGIKAPSLYRHIESKSALLQAVIEHTYLSLFRAYDKALSNSGENPTEQLMALSQAQRTFAHANPNSYLLAYAAQDPELRADPNMLLERAVIIQKIIIQISGEENSLPALRGLLALAHGFIMLELNGQFRRGGDLSAAFEESIRAYLLGWESKK
ncbi:MAG TPA: WHG domain-containing protein [Anaerolineales bacterium]